MEGSISLEYRERWIAVYDMPGSFVNETTTRELHALDPQEALRLAPDKGPYGPGAFSFRIITQLIATQSVDLGGHLAVVQPLKVHQTHTFWIGGDRWDLARVVKWEQEEKPEGTLSALLSNMRANGWRYVVRTPSGVFQPWQEGDVILAPVAT